MDCVSVFSAVSKLSRSPWGIGAAASFESFEHETKSRIAEKPQQILPVETTLGMHRELWGPIRPYQILEALTQRKAVRLAAIGSNASEEALLLFRFRQIAVSEIS